MRFSCVAASLVLAIFASTARSEDPRIEQVRKCLDASKRKLKSGYVVLKQTTNYLPGYGKLNKDFPPASATVNRHCEYGFDNSRQHLLTRTGDNVDSQFDNKTGTLLYRSQLVRGAETSIGLTYVKRPVHKNNILDFGYRIDGRWIADLMKGGTFTVKKDEIHPRFGPTIEVEGRTNNGVDCTLTVAVDRGLAVSYTMFSRDGSALTRTVEEVEEVGGIHFPKRAHLLWLADIDGKKEPYLSMDYLIDSVSINKVPVGFLDVPKLPPGAKVKDDRVGKYFEVGPDGKLLFRGSFDNEATQKSGGIMPYGWFFIVGSVCLLFGSLRFVAMRMGKLAP